MNRSIKNRYFGKRILAWVLSIIMVVTLFTDVGYQSKADDVPTLDFMDIVTSISVTPTSTSSNPIDMNSALQIKLGFKLNDDVEGGFQLSDNYIYAFDLNEVKAENKNGPSTDIKALINSQNVYDLPIVMEGKNVGKYSISNGIVTLNFYDGLEILRDSTISRVGTFEFNCSLNEDAFADEGGDYILKFDTVNNVQDPEIHLKPKDYIKSGVTVEKSDAVFDAATQTAVYTLTVTNSGTTDVNNLVIKDNMGSNLSYDSLVDTSGVTVSGTGQNIEFTLATVAPGVTTIKYKCNVSDGAFTGANSAAGGVSGTNNTISATLDGKNIYLDNSSTKTQDVKLSVKKDVVDKQYVSYDSTLQTIKWTVIINKGNDVFDLGGYTFTDSMSNGQTVVSGSIVVTGPDNAVNEGLENAFANNSIGNTGYTFPNGTTGEYVITYETSVPAHEGVITYNNTATITNGTYTDTHTASSQPIGEKLSEKSFDGNSANLSMNADGDLIIPWKTTVKVPSDASSFTYEDYVQGWYDENGMGFYADNGNIFELSYSDGSNPPALAENTDYVVTRNDDLKYTVALTETGLNKVKGNTVNIKYSTIGKYANKPADSGSKCRNHYNLSIAITDTTLSESGMAETEYTPAQDIIKKTVAGYDAKKHTVTWAIEVNASSTNIFNNLEITDVISDMRYCGYSYQGNVYEHNFSGNEAMKAYIVASDYQTYTVDMVEAQEAGSTPQNPKYKYTISFNDATFKPVSVWGGSSQITDPTAIQTKFTLYYTTKIEGDKLLYNNKSTYSNDVNASTYVNGATTPTTGTGSARQELETKILDKECTQDINDGIATLSYTIRINPDGLKLNPDRDELFYLVEDNLPNSLVYIPAQTVVTDSVTGEVIQAVTTDSEVKNNADGTKYHVSYMDNKLTFTVPDSRPLTITYKVNMLSDSTAGSVSYVNSVKIARPYVSNESSVANQTNKSVASSAANMVGHKLFVVDKVDALNPNNYLSGATFEAKEYIYDNGNWVESGKIFKGTTDATGKISSDLFTLESAPTERIEKNKIYEIRETIAPAGYELSQKVYKVMVYDPDDAAFESWRIPTDTYRIVAGTELIFTDMPSVNTPENKLTITKKYYEADGVTEITNQTEKAVINIYEGQLTLADCRSGAYTPLSTGNLGGGFTYSKEGDVITLGRIPDGYYTVYEYSAPTGFDTLNEVYTFKVENNQILWTGDISSALTVNKTLVNKKTFENSFTINKKYFKASDVNTPLTAAEVPEIAVFTYQQTHYYDAVTGTYVASAGPQTNMSTADGFTYTVSTLPAGKYVIKEAVSDIYNQDSILPIYLEIDAMGRIKATGNGNVVIGDGTLSNVSADVKNVIKDNKITIVKSYYDENGTLIDAGSIPETLGTGDGRTNQQKAVFQLLKKTLGGLYVPAQSVDDFGSSATDFDASTTNSVSSDKYIWGNLEPGDYKLVESLVTSPVQDNTQYESLQTVLFTVDSDYTIKINGQAAGSYEKEVAVDNRILDSNACRFYLTKYIADQSGNMVVDGTGTDVTFKMYKKNVSNGWDEVGTFSFNATKKRWEAVGLGAGEYEVREITTKTNYTLAETIKITISTVGGDAKITSITYGNGTATADFWTTTVSENLEAANVETVVANLVNRPAENSITVSKAYYQPDGVATVVPSQKAEFALYKVEAANETLVETLTANTNDSYVFDKLEPGTYKIKETVTPAGFIKAADISFVVNADYSISVATPVDATVQITANDTLNAGVKANNILSNKFTFNKKYIGIDGTEITATADLNSLLAATSFKVYKSDGVTLTTYTVSNTNSSYYVSDLNDGDYIIRETDNPAGFNTAGDIKLSVSGGKISVTYSGNRTDFTNLLNNGSFDVSATLYNRQKGNSITINKEYYQPGGISRIPMNEVLSFASFKLLDSAGTEVTGVTKSFDQSTGKYTFSNIPAGGYKITEDSLDGYNTVSDLAFTVDLNGNITYTVSNGWSEGTNGAIEVSATAKNVKISNEFAVTKIYLDPNGRDISTQVTNHAEFKLVAANGTEYNMTRQGRVYTLENIPYGTYTLKESVPTGYEQVAGTITVNVAENGKITASYVGNSGDCHIINSGTVTDMNIVLNNHQTTNAVTINKTYVSSTGAELSIQSLDATELAEFRLYTDYGRTYQREITASDKVRADKTSGIYTFMNLDPGDYTVVETAGAGFEPCNHITFTVNSDKTITNLSGAVADANSDTFHKNVSVRNVRKIFDNSIELNKDFYNAGNQLISGTQRDELLRNVDFAMYDSEDNIVRGFSYDRVSKSWKVSGLEPGEYMIKEIAAPQGYIKADDVRVVVTKTAPEVTEITVTYMGVNSEVLTYTYVQGTTGSAKNNIVLSLKNYQEVDNAFVINKKFISNYSQEITDADLIDSYLAGTRFYYKALNGNVTLEIPFDRGSKQYVLEDIQPGTYIVTETAHSEFNAIADITLVVNADGSITVDYQGDSGDINVVNNANAVNEVDVTVNNFRKTSYVNIGKVDITNGKELEGAKLKITNSDNVEIDSWTSSTGVHKIPVIDFRPGYEYTLTEITAPYGYEIAESIVFKVDYLGNVFVKGADGQFKVVTANTIVMKDAPTKTSSSTDVVNTGDATPVTMLFILMILSGIGIVFTKKKRNN